MVKSVQPQEKRTRLERQKFIIVTDPKEEGTACHAGPQGEAPLSVRRQKGARGRPRPQTLLGFLQERQGRAGKQLRIGWFE